MQQRATWMLRLCRGKLLFTRMVIFGVLKKSFARWSFFSLFWSFLFSYAHPYFNFPSCFCLSTYPLIYIFLEPTHLSRMEYRRCDYLVVVGLSSHRDGFRAGRIVPGRGIDCRCLGRQQSGQLQERLCVKKCKKKQKSRRNKSMRFVESSHMSTCVKKIGIL